MHDGTVLGNKGGGGGGGGGRLDTSLAYPQILQGRMTTPQTYQRRGSRIDPVIVVIVLCSTKFNATVSLNLIMMARAKISQQNASTSSTREYFFYPFQKSSLIPRETGAPNVKFGKISVRKTIEIQNFRNICCKIPCLPAPPGVFEHLKRSPRIFGSLFSG